ncbi:galectin-5-like [Arapaima gigas]
MSKCPSVNSSGMWQSSQLSGRPSWPEEPVQPHCPGQQIVSPSRPGQQHGKPDLHCSGHAAGHAGQTAHPYPPNHLGWLLNPGQSGWPGQLGRQAMHPGAPGWPGQGSSTSTQLCPNPPVRPLTIPYNLNLPRGLSDRMLVTMNGAVNPSANKFTIDFHRGNDIAFHINPRFCEAGGQVIVRNHRVGNKWGKEERDLYTQFPFAKGEQFEIKILCTFHEFKVAVNNTQVLEFKHRIKQLNEINQISILDDITLTSLSVDTLP